MSLKEEGNKFFREGQYDDAVSKYSEALVLDPTNAVLYSNRSIAYSKLCNFQNALTDACKCIDLKPQWPKGHLRKLTALEGLARHEEAMVVAAAGFKVTGEGRVKREFVERWLKAGKELYRLPEGSVELPRGILILSKEYLTVLAHLMRSLSGEQPLSQTLMEQCLYSCLQQFEKVLTDFGEVASEAITEWTKHLAAEIYPYVVKPSNKEVLEKIMATRTEDFIHFVEETDPALYPILRPILGLVILVVLNRTNILCESNAAHHAAELMNRALVPLFEHPILKTDDYYSMYIGRICAVLDSFIGRGYRLSEEELSTVTSYYDKLKTAIQGYPKHLPEYGKDRQLAEMALSNVKSNVLEPPVDYRAPSLSSVAAQMNVEIAQGIVKEKPAEVKHFLSQHLTELEQVKFLSMRDVEELLTMTGIFLDLGEQDSAFKVFTKGETVFFKVLGHLLSTNALMLDQCPATIATIRQFVMSQVARLKEPELFAEIMLRWKCLFTELRTQLVRVGLGVVFGDFFQWYIKQRTSTTQSSEAGLEAALVQQMRKEEELLQSHAIAILDALGRQSHRSLLEALNNGDLILDYTIIPTPKKSPLAEAFCVVYEKGKSPLVTQIDYSALRKVAAVVAHIMSQAQKLKEQKQDQESSQLEARMKLELASLAQVVFPQPIMDVLDSGRIKHLFISPDGDLAHLPLTLLPFSTNQSGSKHETLLEKFSVSFLSSSQELIRSQLTEILIGTHAHSLSVPKCSSVPCSQQCLIVADPNYNLQKQAPETSFLSSLINYLSNYMNISEGCPIKEELLYSQEEAEFISSCLQATGMDVKQLTGDNATLSNVLSCNSPLLLHISSHAKGTPKTTTYRGNFYSGLNSTIALAGFNTYRQEKYKLPPDCGTGELPALAVLSMKLLGTRLVFLSTCLSAAGSSSLQEATDNLAQSFLSAGAETVIATLWKVRDSLAAEFSQFFYLHLKEPGVRPSQALSYAKHHISSDPAYAHWAHWGCFVCYGIDKALI